MEPQTNAGLGQKNGPHSKQVLLGVGALAVIVAIALGVMLYAQMPQQKQGTVSAPAGIKKIGFPLITGPVDADVLKGFKEKMAELGYVEGTNVTYAVESVPRGPESVPQITEKIKNMVSDNYDLMVTSRDEVHAALTETAAAGKDIPIVFTRGDIALRKDIQDFRSSGKNATGIFVPLDEIAGKQLEFLQAIAPNAKTVGYLGKGFLAPGDNALGTLFVKAIKDAAPKLGLTLKEYTTTAKPGPELLKEVERITSSIMPGEVDVWMHVPGHIAPDQQNAEGAMGLRLQIPTMVTGFLEIQGKVGMLASYSANFEETGRQAAVMADKIFRGVKPADIPIEFPLKMELSFNRGTAKSIGLSIPEKLLAITNRFAE